MKKVLALVVAFALCFTVFAGCFVTSAADAAYTVVGSELTADGGAATVTISGNYSVKTAKLLTVTIPAALTFDSVVGMNAYDENSDEDFGYTVATVDGATVLKFLDVYEGDFAIVINVTAPANDKEEVVTYNVTASAEIAAWDATEVSVVEANGNVTVAAKVAEPEVPAEPEVVSIQLGRSLLAEKTLGVRFMVQSKQVAAYDSFYILFNSQHYRTKDGVAQSLVEEEIKYTYVAEGAEVPEGYIAQTSVGNNGAVYNFDYFGVLPTEMTLPMSATIYCVKGGQVVAKSQTWEFTFADRIKNTLGGNAGATTKTLYMDMANFGKAAQEYFANLPANANSDLAKNTLYPTAGLEAYFDLATGDDVICSELASKEGFGGKAEEGYTAIVGKGLVIEENNKPRFLINKSTYDVSSLTLEVCYSDSVSGSKDKTVNVADLATDKGNPYYVYGEVALYDASSTVTAKLYVDGNLAYTRTYSVEAFIAEKVNDTAINAFGDALLKFSHSCRIVVVK